MAWKRDLNLAPCTGSLQGAPYEPDAMRQISWRDNVTIKFSVLFQKTMLLSLSIAYEYHFDF